MEISLSRAEYKSLLESLCIARWVSSYNITEGANAKLQRLWDLEEKVCRIGKEQGFDDLVEYDPEGGGHYPTREFEAGSVARQCMYDYEETFFWEELVRQLVSRDLGQSTDAEEWEALSEREREERRKPAEDSYWDEFHKGGVQHLRMVRSEPNG